VEEVPKHEQGLAPTPLHSMVERTAKNWDQLVRHRNATQTPAVSFPKSFEHNLIYKRKHSFMMLENLTLQTYTFVAHGVGGGNRVLYLINALTLFSLKGGGGIVPADFHDL